MSQVAKLVHLLGLALFLGSVLAFAVASSVPPSGDLGALVVARQVISAGTNALTLPGLCLLIVSGIGLAAANRHVVDQPWVRVMAAAALLIVANSVIFVIPAVRSATALAEAGVASGRLAGEYRLAYLTESVAGGVNILLAVAATVAGVWRFNRQG
jgi:hypothetical protein